MILCEVTAKIKELTASVPSYQAHDEYWPALELLQALQSAVDSYASSSDPIIPPERMLRDHFQAVSKLDTWSLALLDLCIGGCDAVSPFARQRGLAVDSILRIASTLSRHPRRGLSSVRTRLKSCTIAYSLISLGLGNASSSDFQELLLHMIESGLVSTKILKKALTQASRNNGAAAGHVSRDILLGLS